MKRKMQGKNDMRRGVAKFMRREHPQLKINIMYEILDPVARIKIDAKNISAFLNRWEMQ